MPLRPSARALGSAGNKPRYRFRDVGSGQAVPFIAAEGRVPLRHGLGMDGCAGCAGRVRHEQRDGDNDRGAVAEYGDGSRMSRPRVGTAIRTRGGSGAGLRATRGAGSMGHKGECAGIHPCSLSSVNMLPILKHLHLPIKAKSGLSFAASAKARHIDGFLRIKTT